MHFLDDPVTFMVALPALPLLLPLFVLVSAMLEYVVPPYWGDSFVLLGFFLSGQPAVAVSPWTVFAATVLGGGLGAAVAFLLGRRYGLAFARRVTPWRPLGSRQRIRRLLTRFGARFLVVNRFVPFIRGLLLYGAGAMRLRFADALLYTTLSNLLWAGVLMGVGILTAGSWEEILAAFHHTHRVIGAAVAVAVAAWIVFLAGRRLRRRSAYRSRGEATTPLPE